MFNRIRRWIGAPFIAVTGILFGLLIWLFYGKEELYRFCEWLDGQVKALAKKELRNV